MTIGIWIIGEGGISCSEWSNRHAQISNDVINAESVWNNDIVWDYVEHIAMKDWGNKENTRDLISALAIKRKLLGLKQQPEIDKKTWLRVLEILIHKNDAA
ncbi:hypothetical protein [Gillisia hiemivivida]|uniref:Uncharacterized protein n=1 Tax=Gillisia hiemivivida TaxID=291190 RepID=A0A5C6ZWF2_9FLAO|nr:hypothetical protein [Gillisia hiemivivida]TXD95185.1 hypothetical protein ES724_03260 [Gillisia hiemivivida]